jgi:hypothetical protein
MSFLLYFLSGIDAKPVIPKANKAPPANKLFRINFRLDVIAFFVAAHTAFCFKHHLPMRLVFFFTCPLPKGNGKGYCTTHHQSDILCRLL